MTGVVYCTLLKHAIRLEAIAIRFEAIAIWLEAIAVKKDSLDIFRLLLCLNGLDSIPLQIPMKAARFSVDPLTSYFRCGFRRVLCMPPCIPAFLHHSVPV